MRAEAQAGSKAAYYDWREFELKVADRVIGYASKPGLPDWDKPDYTAKLLAKSIEVEQGDRLIDLRSGRGIIAALAALRGAEVTVQDDHIIACEATRRTLELNRVDARVEPASDYDAAVLTLPRSRDALRSLVRRATHFLSHGGRLYLAGPNRSGIKSAIDEAKAVFGSVRVAAYGKGHRVAVALHPAPVSSNDDDGFTVVEVAARGARWRIASAPGVFAHGRLDDGTRCLVEAMDIRAGESFLDLGCGCGIVGLLGSRLGAQVVCLDASRTAVEATRRTLALNDLANINVVWSDCASGVHGRLFDVVATNPPFHQGAGADYEVGRQFVRDAADVLCAGGRLILVANRFLRYERVMSGLFSSVRVIHEDGRFRVLEAAK